MEVKEKDNLTITKEEISSSIENKYEYKKNSDVLIISLYISFIFILIILICFCIFCLINTNTKNIISGVYIKGVNVSGLSREEAKEKVSEYINSSIPEEITLKHEDFETSLSSSQLSIYFNVDEAVEMAYQIGKNGNILENNFTSIKSLFSKINIEPRFFN